MASLKQTQELFMAYILSDKRCDNAQSNELLAFSSLISAKSDEDSQTRLGIYASAYRLRLIETIETDHEMLGIYLGDELFDKMAQEYIKAHPSSYRSLRHFCDALPLFLHDDTFFSQHPILSHIAAFERRLLNAFDAEEQSRASFSELEQLAPEHWPESRFRFHSSVQIFKCQSNAVESWQALKNQQTPPQPDYSIASAWLLWRGEERLTEFISLTEYQLLLLEGFLKGQTLAQQCELMLNYFDEEQAPAKVLQAIRAWFNMGIIRAIA
ncbi:DNA-binding domain-containing protein [Shewanella sp. D64]|uniref:HvfC/BufC N-terminal domain-containing protein n=1 Tax=unclassified Shewanella TaxID=196818 RepID=UPI0022BA4689|nr:MULTISPECIES: DNA-binding domain-containing protein [unclassified Shewanella]MEC4725075.1 DNA-binding domain-containing protein [Shewanella sp. D64]MEC4736976.1 DNA-binding domain-containing protein [Shewanella sp. E94]WBJ96567.1 DNA-binding domain-containing protein [Shewanella sp. MTB7]